MNRTRKGIRSLVLAALLPAMIDGWPALGAEQRGRRLFEDETFGGNGRTCQSCHQQGSRTISPAEARALFAQNPADPLFQGDARDDFGRTAPLPCLGVAGVSEVRRHVPDAGGLVIATDQESARAYAALLRRISGEPPTIVLSDEKAASKKIAKFTDSEARWMVAVRMVSEGVDVPRLAVGVWATTTSTPLFFAQAVGRFVRARKRGETASVFLPSVPNLLGFASEMEVERDHVLGRRINDEDDIFAAEQALLNRAQQGESASDEEGLLPFEALGSSATFDRVLYDGGEFGHSGEVHVGSEEEMDFLGIPGLLEPDQVRDLLQSRQSERAKQHRRETKAAREDDTVEQLSMHEQLAMLRRELNGLVSAWNHRTGQPHGTIHASLRRECGGPAAATATADQLRERIDRIRDWAARQRSS
jgi:hypothetical protein